MNNQAYIREVTKIKTVNHPEVSLVEANHWMEQVEKSGYLELKRSEGTKFEIVGS